MLACIVFQFLRFTWDGRSAHEGLPSLWREKMEACLVLLGGRGLDRYPGLLLLSLMLLLMLMLLLLLITIARFGGEPMILNDNEKNKIKKKMKK